MNKKIFAGILCLVSVLSFCSCGDDELETYFYNVDVHEGTYSGHYFDLYVDSVHVDSAVAEVKQCDPNGFVINVNGIPGNKSEAQISTTWVREKASLVFFLYDCEYISESGHAYNCNIEVHRYMDNDFVCVNLTSK